MNRQKRVRERKQCRKCQRPIVARAVVREGKEYCSRRCAGYSISVGDSRLKGKKEGARRKKVARAPSQSKTISRATLDKMAFYFLIMAAELIERDFRKDLNKVIKRVKEKYPEGWDTDIE